MKTNKQLDWKPVIKSLLQTMMKHDYKLISIDDGDTHYQVWDVKDGLETIVSVDETNVVFKNEKGTKIWLYIVLGNAPCETVCDYSIPSDRDEAAKLDKVLEDWSDSWEDRDCPTVSNDMKTFRGAQKPVMELLELAFTKLYWNGTTDLTDAERLDQSDEAKSLVLQIIGKLDGNMADKLVPGFLDNYYVDVK